MILLLQVSNYTELILGIISLLLGSGILLSRRAKNKKKVSELSEYYNLTEKLHKELREQGKKHWQEMKEERAFFMSVIEERDVLIEAQNAELKKYRNSCTGCGTSSEN